MAKGHNYAARVGRIRRITPGAGPGLRMALLMVAALLFLSGCAIVPVHAGGGLGALLTALALALAACGNTPEEAQEASAETAYSLEDSSASEADPMLTFTVTRSASEEAASVSYTTTDGTATGTGEAADFTAVSDGTLDFAAGASKATVEVVIVDDMRDEGDESFTLSLTDDAGETLVTATGTIIDDDGPAEFSVADASATEGDATMDFTVTRSGDTTGGLTVDWATGAGADFYSEQSGTVTFGYGVTEEVVSVTLSAPDDDELQVREPMTLTLSAPSSGAIAEDGTAQGVLADTDNLLRVESWDASLGSFGARLDGASSGDDAGTAVGGGGDIDGDGTDDLIVGAPGYGEGGAGSVYVLTEAPDGGTVDLGGVGNTYEGIAIPSSDSYGGLGTTVAAIGNIDGDPAGTSGLGMGSTQAMIHDQGSNYDTPQAVVIHGDSGLVDTTIELSDGGGEADQFVYYTGGIEGSAKALSHRVAPVGDFDGDGRDDFMVADDRFGSHGGVAIVSGTSSNVVNTRGTGTDAGWYGFHISGTADYRDVGNSIAPAGDVDQDGYADVLVGAPGTQEGAAFIIFGGEEAFENASGEACAVAGTVDDAVAGNTVACVTSGDIAFPSAVRIRGENGGHRLGSAVAAGNVDGDVDGHQDLIIGASSYGGDDEGRVYVIFGDGTRGLNGLESGGEADLGTAVSSLDGTKGFTLTGGSTPVDGGYAYYGDNVGSAVAAVDLNGDGADEIVAGVADASYDSSHVRSGKVFIHWGGSTVGSGGDVDLTSFTDLADGIRIYGYAGRDYVGASVAGAGDINGDGLEDLVIGAPGYESTASSTDNHGAAFVLFGVDIPR